MTYIVVLMLALLTMRQIYGAENLIFALHSEKLNSYTHAEFYYNENYTAGRTLIFAFNLKFRYKYIYIIYTISMVYNLISIEFNY